MRDQLHEHRGRGTDGGEFSGGETRSQGLGSSSSSRPTVGNLPLGPGFLTLDQCGAVRGYWKPKSTAAFSLTLRWKFLGTVKVVGDGGGGLLLLLLLLLVLLLLVLLSLQATNRSGTGWSVSSAIVQPGCSSCSCPPTLPLAASSSAHRGIHAMGGPGLSWAVLGVWAKDEAWGTATGSLWAERTRGGGGWWAAEHGMSALG